MARRAVSAATKAKISASLKARHRGKTKSAKVAKKVKHRRTETKISAPSTPKIASAWRYKG